MCRMICEEATVRFRFQLVSWTTRRAYINGLTRIAAATVHGGSMCRSQLREAMLSVMNRVIALLGEGSRAPAPMPREAHVFL
eukprot:CAMPEP_0198695454 /NCGR_PEP_ID=MMETSP1468-20131203/287832_1 /TAXON_ID=1461545 /ORGANISM="Mantoniella sp, Strain CCMP1436" /LENGTH=81 /DNA_ID=CAMNT_0044451181 /DNA_START=508 /DNA_END=751 /DNA_ORIENTATION=-